MWYNSKMSRCPRCNSTDTIRNGKTPKRYYCKGCRRTFKNDPKDFFYRSRVQQEETFVILKRLFILKESCQFVSSQCNRSIKTVRKLRDKFKLYKKDLTVRNQFKYLMDNHFSNQHKAETDLLRGRAKRKKERLDLPFDNIF